jgi:hypothetical protein
MQHMEIAKRLGVTMMDLENLVKGEATANVAAKFGVTIMDIQDFTRGKATFAMTQRLGFSAMDAAEELAKAAGGAGVLIGYMLNM